MHRPGQVRSGAPSHNCVPPYTFPPSSFPAVFSGISFLVHVELRGGDGYSTGNVFAVNSLGYLGPTCDNNWFHIEAIVVCWQLGFNSGVARTKSYFGNVPNKFTMDDINCYGDEDNIQQCSYKTSDNFNYGDGAGVECY